MAASFVVCASRPLYLFEPDKSINYVEYSTNVKAKLYFESFAKDSQQV